MSSTLPCIDLQCNCCLQMSFYSFSRKFWGKYICAENQCGRMSLEILLCSCTLGLAVPLMLGVHAIEKKLYYKPAERDMWAKIKAFNVRTGSAVSLPLLFDCKQLLSIMHPVSHYCCTSIRKSATFNQHIWVLMLHAASLRLLHAFMQHHRASIWRQL